ncbi:hypothetical protein [Tengunoibacter tsumagoiensis]|uniref:hypothetical protein n=1 Tax=Tengunoibacter tsumagoiensis TaxID=2014871 RepID=UPI00138660FF|nr:hypothetical protein [Tengunoibacter tsumagoiensis]
MRRGRLVSLLLFYILLVVGGLAVPVAYYQNHTLLFVLVLAIGLFMIALAMNHRGAVNFAGGLVTAVVSVAIPIAILTYPGGLGTNTVFLYDMMIQSDLLAVSLLPARSVFIVVGANILFIVTDFYLQSRTSDLTALIAKAGPEVLARPIVLHIIVAVVTYLWVSSSQDAVKRADRAQVIAELQHDIARQHTASTLEKQKLEASIDLLVQTQNRIAQGDLDARVPLTSDNVLWQIGGSLNTLLSRYQKLRHLEWQMQQMQPRWQQALVSEKELENLKKEMEYVRQQLQQAKVEQVPLKLNATGTALDLILKELDGLLLSETTTAPKTYS